MRRNSLTKAIEFNPRYVFALSTKAAMLDEASSLMDRVLEVEPKFEDALANKGRLLINQGRYQESIEYSDRCLAVNPRNARALLSKTIAAVEK